MFCKLFHIHFNEIFLKMSSLLWNRKLQNNLLRMYYDHTMIKDILAEKQTNKLKWVKFPICEITD